MCLLVFSSSTLNKTARKCTGKCQRASSSSNMCLVWSGVKKKKRKRNKRSLAKDKTGTSLNRALEEGQHPSLLHYSLDLTPYLDPQLPIYTTAVSSCNSDMKLNITPSSSPPTSESAEITSDLLSPQQSCRGEEAAVDTEPERVCMSR